MSDTPKGWHSRGYLPHFDAPVYQFITFRLYDSLPQTLLRKLEWELRNQQLSGFDRAFRIKVEELLDNGIGQCFLGHLAVASAVRDALMYYDRKYYSLSAWVIMPNHIHILLRPFPDRSLSTNMKNLKGFTARKANKILGRSGSFWHVDYFDRFIRDEDHHAKTVSYIINNRVKAGLCGKPEEWEFSSAFN